MTRFPTVHRHARRGRVEHGARGQAAVAGERGGAVTGHGVDVPGGGYCLPVNFRRWPPTRCSPLSAITRFPAPSTAVWSGAGQLGRGGRAAVAGERGGAVTGHGVDVPGGRLPVEGAGAGRATGFRLLPWSAMTRFLALSTVTPRGLSSPAPVARPPSPENPVAPLPATRRCPRRSSPARRRACRDHPDPVVGTVGDDQVPRAVHRCWVRGGQLGGRRCRRTRRSFRPRCRCVWRSSPAHRRCPCRSRHTRARSLPLSEITKFPVPSTTAGVEVGRSSQVAFTRKAWPVPATIWWWPCWWCDHADPAAAQVRDDQVPGGISVTPQVVTRRWPLGRYHRAAQRCPCPPAWSASRSAGLPPAPRRSQQRRGRRAVRDAAQKTVCPNPSDTFVGRVRTTDTPRDGSDVPGHRRLRILAHRPPAPHRLPRPAPPPTRMLHESYDCWPSQPLYCPLPQRFPQDTQPMGTDRTG